MSEAVRRKNQPVRPLDAALLRELALYYVGRFATTRAGLERYLARKLRERGWDGPVPPDAAALAASFVALGYIDDAAFAGAKARSMLRRGFGERRINQALWAAGVADSDREEADGETAASRVESALRLAERRRWGPYASEPMADPKARQRALAAFLRAGHDSALARRILALAPGSDVRELLDEE